MLVPHQYLQPSGAFATPPVLREVDGVHRWSARPVVRTAAASGMWQRPTEPPRRSECLEVRLPLLRLLAALIAQLPSHRPVSQVRHCTWVVFGTVQHRSSRVPTQTVLLRLSHSTPFTRAYFPTSVAQMPRPCCSCYYSANLGYELWSVRLIPLDPESGWHTLPLVVAGTAPPTDS